MEAGRGQRLQGVRVERVCLLQVGQARIPLFNEVEVPAFFGVPVLGDGLFGGGVPGRVEVPDRRKVLRRFRPGRPRRSPVVRGEVVEDERATPGRFDGGVVPAGHAGRRRGDLSHQAQAFARTFGVFIDHPHGLRARLPGDFLRQVFAAAVLDEGGVAAVGGAEDDPFGAFPHQGEFLGEVGRNEGAVFVDVEGNPAAVVGD